MSTPTIAAVTPREVPTPAARPRILTTNHKHDHPLWRQRTVLLPGWREEFERMRGNVSGHSWGKALYWAWRMFRASRHFDAVLSGTERAALAFALLQRLARRRRVPHIFVYCWWELPQGGWRRVLKRMWFRWVFGGASRLLVYSQVQRQRHAQVFPFSASKFVCVPYHTTLWGARYPVTEGDYVFAGGDYTRDYATLLEAARGLPYRVVIAALHRDYFQGLAIPSNVEILTATEEQFFRLMAGAGVVAVPLRGGLLQSGGQQTYLNAMQMGKAVVVADDCGAEEYITAGVTGMVVPPGDAAALRAALRTLMENRALASKLGENARAATAGFGPERFFERVLALVDECVKDENHG